jgi:hypothetical protein
MSRIADRPDVSPPRRKRLRRWIVRGVLVVVGLLLVAVAYLWVTKPWVPDIEFVVPGSTGERVVEDGIFANYFPGPERRGPAVLAIGGSEGGIGQGLTDQAIALQRSGFSVLTPSYFGAPGQPEELERVPLETFDRALEWMRARPEIDPDRIAVVGTSKGAEAALLIATRQPELRAVVAGAPSSFAWPGISWTSFNADASWTVAGHPMDVLPYGGSPLSAMFGDVGALFRGGLEHASEHPRAAIGVEKIRGAVLLVCGEKDSLWPACDMARQLRERAARGRGPSVRILAYDRAGHRALGPPYDRDDPAYERLDRWGGTPVTNNAARADAWPKVIDFLRERLRAEKR